MSLRILIAAPPGPTREGLLRFFAQKGAVVRSLEREAIIPRGQLYLEGERVLLDREEILDGTVVAILLDSGYMWPLPVLHPTREQWEAHCGRFDDYLRDERESASLWYSLMSIVSDRAAVCINPQASFEWVAMKPDAFVWLHEAGLSVPPLITSNDPEAVRAFVLQNPGELRELDLAGKSPARWLDGEDPEKLPLEQRPVMLQALPGRDEVRVTAVGGEAVIERPGGALPSDLLDQVAAVSQRLGMDWVDLLFVGGPSGFCLADFGPPGLDGLEPAAAEQILDALWRRIQVRLGARP